MKTGQSVDAAGKQTGQRGRAEVAGSQASQGGECFRAGESAGRNAAKGWGRTRPAKPIGFSNKEGTDDSVKNGFSRRCGQKPDCSGFTRQGDI